MPRSLARRQRRFPESTYAILRGFYMPQREHIKQPPMPPPKSRTKTK